MSILEGQWCVNMITKLDPNEPVSWTFLWHLESAFVLHCRKTDAIEVKCAPLHMESMSCELRSQCHRHALTHVLVKWYVYWICTCTHIVYTYKTAYVKMQHTWPQTHAHTCKHMYRRAHISIEHESPQEQSSMSLRMGMKGGPPIGKGALGLS